MKITLVFPPFVDPRAPYLAVPSLTAFLRAKGHQVIQADLNVLCLSSLLGSAYLETLFGNENHPAYAFCLDHVDQAVKDLRDPTTFFDFQTYTRSRNILDFTLRCISSLYARADLNLRLVSPPIGSLGQIVASVLQGVDSSPFDPLYLDRFVPEILAQDPDVVGISVSNGSQLLPALKLSWYLKARGMRTVLGGPSITRLREELAATKEFFDLTDGAVIFEGEEALERLLDNLAVGKEPFSEIPNCIYRDRSGIVIRNQPFALDLNSLPTPDFHDLPFELYLAPYPVLPLLTSKGCSWGRCSFCIIPDTSSSAGTRIRERSTANVVEDISSLKKAIGARHFFLIDENISAGRLERLGRALIEGNLDVRWLAYSRFEKGHTLERCRTLYASGCRKLLMGLESASPRILRLMKKGIKLSTVHDNLTCLHGANISVNIFCIVGFPSETRGEMEETLEFIRERRHLLFRKGFSCSFAEFVLAKNSEIDRQPEKFGVTKGEGGVGWVFADESPGVSRPSGDELREVRRGFNSQIRDIYYPDEVIGWEEYSVLYVDRGVECRFPWRMSGRELAALLRGKAAGALVLRKRQFRVIEALRPHYRRLQGGEKRFCLMNLDTANALIVSHQVTSFLDEIDGHADLGTIIGKFAVRFQHDSSVVREGCLELVENLWKHGYLERQSTHGEQQN